MFVMHIQGIFFSQSFRAFGTKVLTDCVMDFLEIFRFSGNEYTDLTLF